MKHLLYFAGYRMIVFRWGKGGFTGMAEFEPKEGGFENFERLLKKEAKHPVRLLVDVLEEDFRVDTIPYVYGRDKEAVRQRALTKYFRKYTYKHIQTQGREQKGRRDEIALISALTNAELFKPWLDLLYKLKIPMEGIYTLPLVGELLLKQLDVTNRGVLVISQQMHSSVRESFYQDGKLKLSRLVPNVGDESKRYRVLRDETERTIRFLENQHYVSREGILDVYIIAHGAEHETIAEYMVTDHRTHYHLIDKDILASKVGIKSITPGFYCEWIYAHLLLSANRLSPHYGTAKVKKYYYHYLSKKSMVLGSAVMITLALLFSVSAWFKLYNLSQEQPRLRAETIKYNALYEDTISQISSLQLDVEDVRQAVDVVESIKDKYGHLPLQMVSALSQTLAAQNKILIERLQWLATYDSSHAMGEVKVVETNVRQNSRRRRVVQANHDVLYEKILLDAMVIDFENNPRIAIEKVTHLVETLKNAKVADNVSILKMPYDIDSGSRFTRDARVSSRGENKDAKFTILLIKEIKIP